MGIKELKVASLCGHGQKEKPLMVESVDEASAVDTEGMFRW